MKIKRLLPVLIYLLIYNFAFALAQSDPNLLAWYKFDEGSGDVAYDATDNGNDATISRTDKWDSGGIKSSNCLANLSLYSTLYVEVPSSTFTNIDKQMTLSLWIWSNNCFFGKFQTGRYFFSTGTPTDATKITTDPQFVALPVPPSSADAGSADGFKLQSGSPCIGAGKVITGNGGYDFWGNVLYNGVPDIGAHERQ